MPVIIEGRLEIVWIVVVMSLIDTILTYYLLWVDRSVYPKALKFKELNPLADWIMKKTNYGPWGLLIGNIVTQGIIWGYFYLMIHISLSETIATMNFFFGALFVAVWMHLFNIKQLNQKKEVIDWKKQLKVTR